MKIVVLCEGKTEQALREQLREFVHSRLSGKEKVGVDTRSLAGPILRKKLATLVRRTLDKNDTIGVVALTDVYPNFTDGAEAKQALRRWAGDAGKDPRFRAHAAQFEIEAWIIPFWDEIVSHLGVRAAVPGANPEQINTQRPPSHHLKRLYKRARQVYEKVLDGPKWLTAERLATAAKRCPELKLFLNSLLESAGAEPL